MTQEVTKIIGYSGTLQRLVVPDNFAPTVTAYLWGGGGGGGGNDAYAGGFGGGSGYATKTLAISAGDVIEVAVGGNGTGGASGRSAPGGQPGASYYPSILFNSRNPPTLVSGVALTNVSNGAWCSFLNTYGVWNNSVNYVDNTYNLVVPSTASYTVILSTDNYGFVDIDGTTVLSSYSFTTTTQGSVSLSAGTHTLRIRGYNTGGPGGIGVLIELAAAFAGSLSNAPPAVAAITPGTSGYYVYILQGPEDGAHVQPPPVPLTYTVVANGSIIYQSEEPPPVSVGYPGSLVGVSYDQYEGFNRYLVYVYDLYVPTTSGFSGGRGGYSGYRGYSGAGGGGGGATVLLLNGSVVAVAGGGAGGGGGGRYSAGGVPPGPGGLSLTSSAGQNGQDMPGDGGGGGGGGGGVQGGNGGSCPGGDAGGNAGFYGVGLGDIFANPTSSQQPANASSSYRFGNPGLGGSSYGGTGTSGQATFVFGVGGTYVYNAGQIVAVNNVYVKTNGAWTPVKSTWIKTSGVWRKVQGNLTVNFDVVAGNFGIASRPF
jgi:hypothetical protein